MGEARAGSCARLQAVDAASSDRLASRALSLLSTSGQPSRTSPMPRRPACSRRPSHHCRSFPVGRPVVPRGASTRAIGGVKPATLAATLRKPRHARRAGRRRLAAAQTPVAKVWGRPERAHSPSFRLSMRPRPIGSRLVHRRSSPHRVSPLEPPPYLGDRLASADSATIAAAFRRGALPCRGGHRLGRSAASNLRPQRQPCGNRATRGAQVGDAWPPLRRRSPRYGGGPRGLIPQASDCRCGLVRSARVSCTVALLHIGSALSNLPHTSATGSLPPTLPPLPQLSAEAPCRAAAGIASGDRRRQACDLGGNPATSAATLRNPRHARRDGPESPSCPYDATSRRCPSRGPSLAWRRSVMHETRDDRTRPQRHSGAWPRGPGRGASPRCRNAGCRSGFRGQARVARR